MRISDWSSDVCSSDLVFGVDVGRFLTGAARSLATGIGAVQTRIISLDALEDRLWRWQATGELLALLVEFQRPQPRREARQLVRRPPLRWRWAERQRIDRKSTRLNSSH